MERISLLSWKTEERSTTRGVRREVVSAAKKLTKEHPDIGAILLECSDMPPYASAVQAEVRLPVFDFITQIHTEIADRTDPGYVRLLQRMNGFPSIN